jgi:hypothetical protein
MAAELSPEIGGPGAKCKMEALKLKTQVTNSYFEDMKKYLTLAAKACLVSSTFLAASISKNSYPRIYNPKPKVTIRSLNKRYR